MTRTRTHFPFRIDVWTTNGESIVEKVVGWDPVQSPGTLARGYPSRIKLGVSKICGTRKLEGSRICYCFARESLRLFRFPAGDHHAKGKSIRNDR